MFCVGNVGNVSYVGDVGNVCYVGDVCCVWPSLNDFDDFDALGALGDAR